MSAILSIGSHCWYMPSAAVAAAIQEALTTATRMERVSQTAECFTWRTAVGEGPNVQIDPVSDMGIIGNVCVAVSPRVQVVLGEPTKSRRRTHQILNAEGRRLALAERSAR